MQLLSPLVSLIVPIRNSAEHVEPLFQALRRLTFDRSRLEIIVVENNSRDETPALLHKAAQQLCDRIHLIRERRVTSSYAARNAGIRVARGEILAFTDADCRPSPDWLDRLAEGFTSPEIGLVAGEIAAAGGESWIERYAARWRMLSQVYTLGHPYCRYAQTANLAIRRDVFSDIGLFRPEMTSGGDADLCWRALAKSWELRFVPEAVVSHHHRTTLQELGKQWRHYGRGQRHLQDLYGFRVSSARSVVKTAAALMSSGLLSGARRFTPSDLFLGLWCWHGFVSGTRAVRFADCNQTSPRLRLHRTAPEQISRHEAEGGSASGRFRPCGSGEQPPVACTPSNAPWPVAPAGNPPDQNDEVDGAAAQPQRRAGGEASSIELIVDQM